MAGCEFGLCRREARLAVQTSGDAAPVLVCGMHVDPLLTWGVVLDEVPLILIAKPERGVPAVAEPAEQPTLRVLPDADAA